MVSPFQTSLAGFLVSSYHLAWLTPFSWEFLLPGRVRLYLPRSEECNCPPMLLIKEWGEMIELQNRWIACSIGPVEFGWFVHQLPR